MITKPAIFLALLAILPVVPAAPVPAIHAEYNANFQPMMPLEDGWQNPPLIARTRVWWWWLNGQTDKETITRDLEAMKAAGMGGANVIDAGGDTQEGNKRVPHGPDFGSPAWRVLFTHAVAEADRLGLELGFNIQSGWNLGGPPVTADQSSKRIVWSEMVVEGGKEIVVSLPVPSHKDGYYRDFGVVAYPLAADLKVAALASSSQIDHPPAAACDGDPASFWVSGGVAAGEGPTASTPQWLSIDFGKPVMADSLILLPRDGYGPKSGEIQIIDNGGSKVLATFDLPANGPATISFPATTCRQIRIHVTGAWDPKNPGNPRNVQIAEVALAHGGQRVAPGLPRSHGIKDFEQKAYYKYPGQFTGTEAWHLLDGGPAGASQPVCAPDQVQHITSSMDKDGHLRWSAPAGRWQILRFGYTVSGAHVSTSSENWNGYAIDYLDSTTFDGYWQSVLDPILADVRPWLGKSLRFFHTDSWELGPVNWTPKFAAEFERLRGYSLVPYLPVLAGRTVGDTDTTTRFLNDFRRTLADLMAANKYTGFARRAHQLGVGIHPESGGPHAGPMDALLNLGISDVPMGEFWSPSPRHRVRDDQKFFVKQTTSAAHTYGRRVSLAEAFTNIGRHWQHDPRSLKATFDRAACEGHNLTMWHTFDSSPKAAGMPGNAYFAGEHLNPNVTWWPQAKAFISYMNRCHFLLQQGVGASDVLHFYGENIPAFVRLKRDDPARCLPGYDYDVINLEALLERTSVRQDGAIVLPEGTAYKLLSLVPHDAIDLPALRHIARLAEAGATVVGPRPHRRISLGGFATSDSEFDALCAKLWGSGPHGETRVGKGRVIWGKSTRDVLQADKVPGDFTWTGGDKDTFIDFIHKTTSEGQIYFVANRNDRPEKSLELVFRQEGLLPEIWDPVTGSRRAATDFRIADGRTFLPYPMHGEESFFVVFRKPFAGAKPPSAGPNVPDLQALAAIDGPWQVAFDPAWGGPAETTFDRLIDWTSHSDDGIRHYSGGAIYSTTFDVKPAPGRQFLDLGMVESLCEATLNGEDLGILWSAPFRAEITGKLKPTGNVLRVKVVNLWCNRIIGDAALPAEKRRTRTNITQLTKDTPLEPSGLLGPVRVLQESR